MREKFNGKVPDGRDTYLAPMGAKLTVCRCTARLKASNEQANLHALDMNKKNTKTEKVRMDPPKTYLKHQTSGNIWMSRVWGRWRFVAYMFQLSTVAETSVFYPTGNTL